MAENLHTITFSTRCDWNTLRVARLLDVGPIFGSMENYNELAVRKRIKRPEWLSGVAAAKGILSQPPAILS